MPLTTYNILEHNIPRRRHTVQKKRIYIFIFICFEWESLPQPLLKKMPNDTTNKYTTEAFSKYISHIYFSVKNSRITKTFPKLTY